MSSRRKPKEAADDRSSQSEYDDNASVTAFLDALDHPLKPVLEAMRTAILAADRRVTEGIKWKAPSFYYFGWFATVNIRAPSGVQLILHHGVKPQKNSTLPDTIDDPSQMLKWLARDRATIIFSSVEDFERRRKAFKKIIQQWVKHQAHLAGMA